MPACPDRWWGRVAGGLGSLLPSEICWQVTEQDFSTMPQAHFVMTLKTLLILGGYCVGFFKHECVSGFVPSCKRQYYYKLCWRLIPTSHTEPGASYHGFALLPFLLKCPWPGICTARAPITTTQALSSLGPKYPKLVHSSEVERPVSAVRLPPNLILWHTGTSLLEGTTCLCTAELSQVALNSHSNQKVIPHLDTHFQVMILYVPFFTNMFPEGIQPSSEFPHRGTSCLRVAGEGCWNGCKGTCPFSFPFFLPHTATLVRKPPINWCYLWLVFNFPLNYYLNYFTIWRKEEKDNRKIKFFTL